MRLWTGNLDQQSDTLRQPTLNSAGGGVSSPRASAILEASPQRSVESSDLLPVTAAGGSPVEADRLEGGSLFDLERMPFAQELDLASDMSWDLNVPFLPLFPVFIVDDASDFMLELDQLDLKSIEFSYQRVSEPGLSSLFLEQLGPLQAKCGAVQALLRGPGLEVPEDVVTRSIGRDNLPQALQLFSRNFHHHIPILHAPTFNLATASPLLVLAMFTVGACYTDIVHPAKYISAMAIRVWLNLEKQ
ncbi:c2h2 transcription factor [Fusarium phyllophilum]|uniref:C2h2 transcription factor n=1 Tax=Fusarium phyllophilum TaxID=47803 RepID=A0A8H5IJK6_9HYPO|nr:c2h2 transcription factor [Fusarium phyllophilum]